MAANNARRTQNSGERTRLACWRWRPRQRELSQQQFVPENGRQQSSLSQRGIGRGEAPRPAREARALPRRDRAALNFNVRVPYGAGGEAAMSVASARCFGRGQPKARRPSNQAVPNGTSPGTQIV